MGVINGSRHQFRRFITGVTKHQTLIASTLIEIDTTAFIDTLSDIGRLLVIADQHGTTTMVNTVIVIVVTDTLDGIACYGNVIDIGCRGNFTGQNNQPGITKGFSCHTCRRILFQNGIQNGIGNLVGNFIGMSFRNRFGSKEIILRHKNSKKGPNCDRSRF